MNHTNIDLHLHSTVSDGTDTPAALLEKAKAAGLGLIALTDHDAVKGYGMLRDQLKKDDPLLLSGAEFSCRDGEGKYHILGYAFDPESDPIRRLTDEAHHLRLDKVNARLEHLRTAFGFTFPEAELQALFALDNPGKPHIANLMVKYGFAEDKQTAIHAYIDRAITPSAFLRPEQAIDAILRSGGIPVLAHPVFGSGEEEIVGADQDQRVRRLRGLGLKGIEGFYSGFSAAHRAQVLALAEEYGLMITAGSDYHGRNKTVRLGDTGLDPSRGLPEGLERFLASVLAGS